MGKSFFYAGNVKQSVNQFMLALKSYNEHSESMKAHFGKPVVTNYNQKRYRLLRQKAKELA
jgi:hypothetical protein